MGSAVSRNKNSLAQRTPLAQGTPLAQRARLFVPFRSWRLQLIAGLAAVVVAILSAQSFASASPGATTYQIQPGDTLSAIADATGIAIDKLVNWNSINDPNLIIAGHSLRLSGTSATAANSASPANSASTANPASPANPANPASTAAQPAGQYTVKAGDTVWDIAKTNGASVDDLVQLNGLGNADTLAVGQVLKLPVTAGPIQHTAAVSQKQKPMPGQSQTQSQSPTQSQNQTQSQTQNANSTTPSPKSAPAPKPTQSLLQQKVAAEAARVAGTSVHVGVAATNLVTGEKLAWHADDSFPSASVMKLPILVELERQIAAGNLAWTESLRAEVSAMIAISDNTAANQIASAVHPQSVNETMAKLGLADTHFVNLFNDGRSSSNAGGNVTTPANMAQLLQLIATDQIVSSQASGDIRSLLARNADRSKLVRLLPGDAQVGHKSGWYDGVANDVGIVSVDRVPTRWVIAVFTQNIPDAETGNQLVAAISKAVYDAWAP